MSAEKQQDDVVLSQQIVEGCLVSRSLVPDCSGQQVETANVVDWNTLEGDADEEVVKNQRLFIDIGTHVKNIETSHDDIGTIVHRLRRLPKPPTLKDWSSFEVAKWYLRQGHPAIDSKSLNKYCCHLRSLLSMPEEKLPAKISISAPVPSVFSPGDQIDVMDSTSNWWHAFILSETKNKYNVYWVGLLPQVGSRRCIFKCNPEEVDKHTGVFRVHEDGFVSGESEEHTVDWIIANFYSKFQPRTFREIVPMSVVDELAPDSADEEPRQGNKKPKPKPSSKPIEEPRQGNKKTKPKPSSKPKPGKKEPETNKRSRGGDNVDTSDDGDDCARSSSIVVYIDDGADDEHDGPDYDVDDHADDDGNDSSNVSNAEPDADADDDDTEDGSDDNVGPLGSDGVAEEDDAGNPASKMDGSRDAVRSSSSDGGHPQMRFRTMLNVLNDVEKAILTLMALHAGLPVHATLFDDLSSTLISVARFSAEHYCNTAYDTLASETLTELASYQGQEGVKLPHTQKFLKSLSEYGFCITPRLWKKEEIVCIAITLLDPRLHFSGIDQKDGLGYSASYRGMALLDPRVQRIFYERLRLYGFVNPRFHPEKLQTFSSVVINGGGSWQQDTTWEFPVGTRFQIDTTAVPFMLEVSANVGALEANGIYVATKSRNHGKPVYVQVSKLEYDGFVGQVGFRQCLKLNPQNDLKKKFLNSKGGRLDACSPRVLICLDGHKKWGIQLLPAYGSDFFIVEFERGANNANNDAKCFASMDFNKLKSIFQSCCISVSNVVERSADVLTRRSLLHGHALSFGPTKVTKSKLDIDPDPSFKVTPLGPQGFHSDGPIRSNHTLFDYIGKLKTNAPACRHRKGHLWTDMWDNPLKKYLPDHISIMQESFSALFGIFKGTYVQTKASLEGARIDALNVNIPLGCAVVFTFAWKHRGKGDDAHTATSLSPVAVHARPHFYCLSSDVRKLPTIDFEAALEFMSVCAQKQPDCGSKILALDSLQTFDRSSALGHWDAPEVHAFFANQQDLDKFVKSQLLEQRATKQTSRQNCSTQCMNWNLNLSACHQVELRYTNDQGRSITIEATRACFDSDVPSFLDSNGSSYNLVGPPQPAIFPATNLDASQFRDDFQTYLLPILTQLNESLPENWCESHLARLLSVLDAQAVQNGQYFRTGLKLKAASKKYFSPRDGHVQFVDGQCVLMIPSQSSDGTKAAAVGKNDGANENAPPRSTLGTNAGADGTSCFAAGAVESSPSASRSADDAPSPRLSTTAVTSRGHRSAVVNEVKSLKLIVDSPATTLDDRLPAFARGRLNPDVHRDDWIWDEWQDCNIAGVGGCHVWNVYTCDRSSDDIAIQLLGDCRKYIVVNRTIHYDDNSNRVTCLEVGQLSSNVKRQFVHFEQVCDSFAGWARQRQARDYSAEHNASFQRSNLVRVDCGGDGNCFYHSCKFLLESYDMSDSEAYEFSHSGLRTATVNHFKTHYHAITYSDTNNDTQPVHVLIPKKQRTSDLDEHGLQQLVDEYCDKQGKLGEYVEDPCVRVFAHLMDISIIVYHTSSSNPVEINRDESVQRRILTLWCNHGHFQVSCRPLPCT